MTKMIYKILRQNEWQAALALDALTGSPADIADGYIHFSTAHQVRQTAARHFSGESDLILLSVDPDRLGTALRWEASRDGDLFPHLYGVLPLHAIAAANALLLGDDGVHRFSPAMGI